MRESHVNSERITHHLDAAATSHPKPDAVGAAMLGALSLPGNPRRGAGTAARDAERRLEDSRKVVAEFVGASPARLAFTAGATDALNGAIASLAPAGARVLVSELEHASVLRPLLRRHRAGLIQLARVAPGDDGLLDPDEVARRAEGASLVALTAASNVTGLAQPVAAIAARLPRGVPLLVDAAQAAGSLPLDVAAFGPQAVTCLSGHKGLLGPMGCGVIAVGDDVDLAPWREGGTGDGGDEQPSTMPWRLEAGTPPLPAILGLSAGVAWWTARDPAAVRRREQEQLGRIVEALRRAGAALPGWRDGERAPLACFSMPGLSAEETAQILELEHGVLVRAGLHCAPAAHRHLGTWPAGLVRASVGPTTSDEAVAAFESAIADLARG